ncbi:hypothetical protein Nepgr_013592 [Nepenthes gracilis]|uniref:RRM domain-containing protein n=1 Tax=Nepenthes gracilis TaxID=150966 RepID=A0AAD3SJH1_NEPGR|nr:hypothetical protein Nepgr_013592 [Nepenthes gracilis]
MGSSNSANGQLGDTTLTKVFVGGLAWETPKEAIRDHFAKYGEILEAVIIFDKATARSKGYGFVTFKEPNAAKKACEDSSPIISGRRANCNLAALGARRSKLPPALPPQLGSSGVAHVHWYYPASGALPAAAPFLHGHHQALPYYGPWDCLLTSSLRRLPPLLLRSSPSPPLLQWLQPQVQLDQQKGSKREAKAES